MESWNGSPWNPNDFEIHPTIVALTRKSVPDLVNLFNRTKYGSVAKTSGLSKRECQLLNGLLLYHILSKNDLLVEKRRYASHKANLSGRIFEDTFERLFGLWSGDRNNIFLAYVDKIITGIDYVVCRHNPPKYLAGVQCRFSLGGTKEEVPDVKTTWNHWRKLKDDLSSARHDPKLRGVPLAALIFQTGPSVPKRLTESVGDDVSAVFLNHGGVLDLKIQVAELEQIATWFKGL